MPCFKPRKGFYSKERNPSGKRSITFNRSQGYVDLPVTIKCAQCIGCRLEHSLKWAVRLTHEATLYEDNSYITLTYDDQRVLTQHKLKNEHPVLTDGTLFKKDFQEFMKRLRERHSGRTIRYFHCGEYGEKNYRPHYHAALFNYGFPDKYPYTVRNGFTVYRSKELEEIWPFGNSEIGSLTFQSAAYVARYITKKITGERAEMYYMEIDPDTGEILRDLIPEYATMSKKPGLGYGWFEKFKRDVYPDDFVIINGAKCKVPKYYDQLLEKLDFKLYQKVKAVRKNNVDEDNPENQHARLCVKEELQYLRLERLKRGYENDT